MKQQTFSDIEYSNRKRKTKREAFLEAMDEIIPWSCWVNMIWPYYPSGRRGRPPKEIEVMLRIYFMQNWFNLSDEGIKDEIYDSYEMHSFMHLDFLTEQVPDATTLLHFRHLMEKNLIGEKVFHDVKESLEQAGLIMHGEQSWMPRLLQLQNPPKTGTESGIPRCISSQKSCKII